MKHTRLTALLLLGALILSGCGSGLRATRIIEDSDVYSRWEIETAMHTAARFFDRHFDGCTLLSICYEEDPETPPADDRTIRLTSSFRTGAHTEGSLSPDQIYSGYSWELSRGPLGLWRMTNWGYG